MNASHWARYTETFIPLLFFDAWEGGETSPYWRIIRSVRRATISFLKPNSLAFDLENSRTDFEATSVSAQANMRLARMRVWANARLRECMFARMRVCANVVVQNWGTCVGTFLVFYRA